MGIKRGISLVSDDKIRLHPCENDPVERIISHKENLSFLGYYIGEMYNNDEPRLLIIVGDRDSGKSILAKALAEFGTNTLLIHTGDVDYTYRDPIDLPPPPFKSNPPMTYIVDDANHVKTDSLLAYIESAFRSEGIIILLVRDLDMLDGIIGRGGLHFRLTRQGLSLLDE